MKTILLACGSGVATSTAVAMKVKALLLENGYTENDFKLVQCAIAEAPSKSKDADLLIATTQAPDGIACPYLPGIAFLTGVGVDPLKEEILACMKS